MASPQTREQAIQTIAEIRSVQQTLTEQGRAHEARFQNLEKKADDLMSAQRVLTERTYQAPEPSGGIPRLGEYVNKSYDEKALPRGGVSPAPVHFGPYTKSVQLPACLGGEVVKVQEHGLLSDPHPADAWHQDLIRLSTSRSLARMCQKVPNTPQLDYELYKHFRRCPSRDLRVAIEKAFNDTSGLGAEWIPDQFLPDIYQEFQTPRRLRGLLAVINVTGNTALQPRLTVGARPYIKGSIKTDDPRLYTPSTPTTDDTTINMNGLAVRVIADDAALEDSAVAAGAILRRELLAALDDGFEDAMLNADSAGTHQDSIALWNIRSRWGSSGLGGDADHRRYFLGWRAKAFDTSDTTDLSGSMSVANWAAIIGALAERAAGNLVGVTSPEAMVQDFLTLSQVLTLDAYGASATILSGELAQLLGVPLVMSRFMSNDLATTGLFTNTGATTGALVVDLGAYSRYSRRGATLEVQKDIRSGSFDLVATVRETMASPDPAATTNAHFGYNL